MEEESIKPLLAKMVPATLALPDLVSGKWDRREKSQFRLGKDGMALKKVKGKRQLGGKPISKASPNLLSKKNLHCK